MTEDVGDLLDRCAVLQQPGRQRVSERMHAVAALLADRDMSCSGVLDQNLVQMVLVGERADRGGVAEEHLWAVADRTARPDIVDDRPADVLQQRQPHPVAGLRLAERQSVARPVEIGELQPFDVDAAQPKPGDQQDDRVIALPARVAPVDRVQDLGHLGWVPDRWDPGLLARPHGRDRIQYGGADQALAGREPEERPQRTQLLLNGLELVARQRGDERLDRTAVTTSHPAAGVQERNELPGHRRVRPHGRRGPVGGPQPRLESGDGVDPAPGQPADAAGVAA